MHTLEIHYLQQKNYIAKKFCIIILFKLCILTLLNWFINFYHFQKYFCHSRWWTTHTCDEPHNQMAQKILITYGLWLPCVAIYSRIGPALLHPTESTTKRHWYPIKTATLFNQNCVAAKMLIPRVGECNQELNKSHQVSHGHIYMRG